MNPAEKSTGFFVEKEMMKRKVTIQGVSGCYHDAAARAYFANDEVDTVACETFDDMFDRLKGDASLIGIMAIENTIAGSLLQNHELLRQSNLTVVGEYKMRISHVLCALPATIDNLTEVNSHPMALMQCGQYLHKHPNLKIVEKRTLPEVPVRLPKTICWGMRQCVANTRQNCTDCMCLKKASKRTNGISRVS